MWRHEYVMKRISFIWLLLIVAFMTSCGTAVRLVRMEILSPAQHPVPYADKTFAIFNALHVAHEDENGSVTYATDSVMVNLLAEGAKEELEKSPLFGGYDIPIYNLTLFCSDSCPELYDAAYMASLSEQSQASLLLIIDDATTNLQKSTAVGKSTFRITHAALYRFYDVEQQRYVATRQLRDSVDFVNPMLRDLTAEDMQGVWRDVIHDAGCQALELTVPQWITGYRFYYLPFVVSQTEWDNAAYWADEGNWPEAMKIWGRLAESSTGKKAAYAAFNMALGAEMLTEYELALEWLALADESAPLKETDDYRKRIRQRMADMERLNIQLGY
jgi:tetratricopeptide (TPR) repeat protein